MKDMYVRHVRLLSGGKEWSGNLLLGISAAMVSASRALETELRFDRGAEQSYTGDGMAMEDECYLDHGADTGEAEAEAMIDAYMPAVRERIGAYIYRRQRS